MKKLAILVSGGGTNLQCIIDAIENSTITNAEIAVVISSNPDAYALERARKAGIKTEILDRNDDFDREKYTQNVIHILKDFDVDLVIMAGFMTILNSNLIKRFQNRIINIHPSLIPAFSGDGFYGLKPHEAAIERGVKIGGATAHFVNEVVDGGPIILQKSCEIKDGDTPQTLQQRVMTECEQVILPQAINLFCNDKLEVRENKVYIKD